ncbi:MAG TPA: hypothetical protein VNU97_10450 [Rhizomicrobium sp.]|nr:hypothetical protein [Rhizomicrobium sp.]
MKRLALFVTAMLLVSGNAFASSSSGNGALALAALIGQQSPFLSPAKKTVLAHFLAGQTSFPIPPGANISVVNAAQVTCRMGDVDITQHSCDLKFGSTTITLSGRPGQELLATMIENGVQSDGAAGTIYYSVAPISCTVNASVVQSNGGGGAHCTYTNGP